jgi:hypothetical protein
MFGQRNAKLLYEATQYGFALYAAGVAVESLLRAYIVQSDPMAAPEPQG